MSFLSPQKMNFCLKNLIFSEYKWVIANRSWGWNNLSNVIYFQNKVWYLRCSILKNSTFFEIFLNTQRFRLNYCYFLFRKIWQFFTFFFKKLNFGLMVWTICVTPELLNIGGLECIIWSPPSSNGLVIGALLASGGRKNHFFSLQAVDGITTFNFLFYIGEFDVMKR